MYVHKAINRFRKEINRLLSKGISNIDLKVTIEKNMEKMAFSKSLCILSNKITNFDKNKTESKMEYPIHSFRETNFVLQLI